MQNLRKSLLWAILLGGWCSAGQAQELPPAITPGRETTRIEGPLRADGTVNFAAALHEQYSRGVTLENNAVVPLVRALGPSVFWRGDDGGFYERSGIDPLPEEGAYFLPLNAFIRHELERTPGAEEQSEAWRRRRDALERQELRAYDGPWTEEECPDVVRWLDDCETALAMCREGVKRPRYYYYPPHDDDAIAAPLPVDIVDGARQLAYALQASANRHLGAGNAQGAIEDALACHRLAAHVSHGPDTIDSFVADALNALANSVTVRLLAHGKLTAEECRALHRELANLPAFGRPDEKIDYAARYFNLDVVREFTNNGLDCLFEFVSPIEFPLRPNMTKEELAALLSEYEAAVNRWDRQLLRAPLMCGISRCGMLLAIDFNETCRTVNETHDALAAELRQPDARLRAARMRELDWFSEKPPRLDAPTFKPGVIAWIAAPRQVLGRMVGEKFMEESFVDVATGLAKSELRRETENDMRQLALLLAAYRAEEGEYPERLEQLAPKYLAELPQDPYGEEAYRYRRLEAGFIVYSMGENGRDDGGKHRGLDDETGENEELAEADDFRFIVTHEKKVNRR